jgi:3-hydroxyacyl-CoA dehydrogenase/3a,7a,12a-trihydroxy-5b-cholest-24-enoyl-CoA hydratase
MGSDLRFDGRVVIVTGAGAGLGRSHALLFASRGAKVVVNDLGGKMTGGGQSTAAADKVVAEIKAAGGEAVANYDSVVDGAKIVQCALDTYKKVDVVINNAGILRDASFRKMTEEDWDLIYTVHVRGGFKVSHAAWPHMLDAGYGRIIFTVSSAGVYGNFGQANYAMAKLGLLGLSNTLAIEGAKKNVKVNSIAPFAGSRLTETVLAKDMIDALKPEYVSPLVAWLCHDSCETTGGLFEVGGGVFTKLRWERTEGKIFKLGRAISPEAVQSSFEQISDFGKATHPPSIAASMEPIVGNLGTKSRGGNEFIDVDEAMGASLPDTTSSYTERDLALYALGVGAARDPLDANELKLVFELNTDGFYGLPTYGVVPAINAVLKLAMEGKQAPGLHYGLDRILHGEQLTEVLRPLPPHATLRHKAKIKDIFDKGKGAVVVTEINSEDAETGELLIKNEVTMFVRGAGGWGGDRGPSSDVNVAPDRAPDATITEKTADNQALLYRLSGDWNPLHADPSFAQAFGFPKPILHGLCTFGYVGRHVIKAFAGGDPRLFKSIRCRFAETVFPGETLRTEMWKEADGKIIFRTKVVERDKVVISNAAIELYKEIPKPKAVTKAAASGAAAPAAAAGPAVVTTPDIFVAINEYVGKNPELVAKVQTVFAFKISSPSSEWTLDMKTGPGSVAQGLPAKADVTLELADSDWLAMTSGKADPMKLFTGGKLKISGNVMASQKLDFLKKVDPATALAAAAKRGGGAAPVAAAATAAPVAAAGYASADVFAVIGAWVAEHPEVAEKVKTTYQINLSGPDSTWTLDMKGKGSVAAGAPAKADCTLNLSDADWLAMTSGKADPMKLFTGGKLKITGNVMASQKLDFLKQIDPAKVKVAKKESAAAPAAVAGPVSADPKAKVIFAKLAERLAKTPALLSEIKAVVQFKVTAPDAAFTVDLKNAPGSVKEGSASAPDTTLTLSDDDLAALARGTSTAKDLFMHGTLKVGGDVTVAHRLGFMKQLI